MILQTQRLILREMTSQDKVELCKILQDKEVMTYYEHTFDDTEVEDWLNRQIARYKEYGFGLWAVILKSNGEMIGQCGITIQTIKTHQVAEIGYLFQKDYWNKGYATEAARACKEYGFSTLGLQEIYSIIRENNIASQKVALRNGMKKRGSFVKHYYGIDMPHYIFSVTKPDPIHEE